MKKILYLAVLFFSTISLIKAQSVAVHPDGTHSVVINHGSTPIIINPDGTHSVGINHGNIVIAVDPGGTHSVGVNHFNESADSESHLSHPMFSQRTSLQYQEDALFTEDSNSYEEEVHKLRILMLRKIIRLKEYRALIQLSMEAESDATIYKANQVFELHQLLACRAITAKEYRLRKNEIIAPGDH